MHCNNHLLIQIPRYTLTKFIKYVQERLHHRVEHTLFYVYICIRDEVLKRFCVCRSDYMSCVIYVSVYVCSHSGKISGLQPDGTQAEEGQLMSKQRKKTKKQEREQNVCNVGAEGGLTSATFTSNSPPWATCTCRGRPGCLNNSLNQTQAEINRILRYSNS